MKWDQNIKMTNLTVAMIMPNVYEVIKMCHKLC